MPKHTKIIATAGPSTDDPKILSELMRSGVDVFRLNFSHGAYEEHKARMDAIKQVRNAEGFPCAILLDTKGPEIRTGLLPDNRPLKLCEGEVLVLAPDPSQTICEDCGCSGAYRVAQTFPALDEYVCPGTMILLDDGKVELEVDHIDGSDIVCRVLNNCELGERKSVNVPGISIPHPALSEKDKDDLVFGIEQEVDFVAASFVSSPDDIREIKAFLKDHGGGQIAVIAKIENKDAVDNIIEIISVADGVMVARGDLGVELPAHEVPHLQKYIIGECNRAHKPVITATQMLESMTVNPRPTRAEAGDVANAIYDGTDCVMLSGETAAGRYPVEAVHTMVDIIETTERYYFEDDPEPAGSRARRKTVSSAVGAAAVHTAEDLQAKCLVCPTMTGRSARLMSSLRAPIPIYAVTPHENVMRSMQIFWGVYPLIGNVEGSMRSVIDNARDVVEAAGYLSEGDIAVFTVGDRYTSPVTRDADGNIEKFAPANVMYVVQIRSEEVKSAANGPGEGALMTAPFFDYPSA